MLTSYLCAPLIVRGTFAIRRARSDLFQPNCEEQVHPTPPLLALPQPDIAPPPPSLVASPPSQAWVEALWLEWSLGWLVVARLAAVAGVANAPIHQPWPP